MPSGTARHCCTNGAPLGLGGDGGAADKMAVKSSAPSSGQSLALQRAHYMGELPDVLSRGLLRGQVCYRAPFRGGYCIPSARGLVDMTSSSTHEFSGFTASPLAITLLASAAGQPNIPGIGQPRLLPAAQPLQFSA